MLLCLAELWATPSHARANSVNPSFDCAKAVYPVEFMICGDATLAGLDSALATKFRNMREGLGPPARAAALQDQRRWLATRLTQCGIPFDVGSQPANAASAKSCLIGVYRARVAALGAQTAAAPQAATGALSFDHTIFEAKGTHEAILTVPTFGRYSISVTSSQGTALQLVDRMTGPADIQGIPGARDGRIDAFLERGTYKLRVIADARGSGDAELSVTPFTEMETVPTQLVEQKPIVTELGDHEQRSWWLQVGDRGTYNFEAGGRYLTELRLWQGGGWMVAASPVALVSDPGDGQPLALRQLTAHLEPGLYRLTAYGGPGEAWTSGSAAKPFMLRWGLPRLADAGRTIHAASILGIDRYIVPGTATDIRLVIDHSEPATIRAYPFTNDGLFDSDQMISASIDKTSRDPVADLSLSTSDTTTPWVVTVDRTPGARYRLEVLNSSSTAAQLTGTGNYLLATTLPGDPDDEIDPGFLLVDVNGRMIASSAIDLAHALPWRRHFNLIGEVQTYLYAIKSIDLKIDGSGAANAEFLVDRFLVNAPYDRVVPLPKSSGGVWTLTPGYYVLSVIPKPGGLGILTMSLYANNTPPPTADSPRLPAALFQSVELNQPNSYTLYSSLGDNANFGLRRLSLPAALDQPLSFELASGEAASIPIITAEDGQLAISDESGAGLAFTIDGDAANGTAELPAGEHTIDLTGPGIGDHVVTLTDTPTRLLAATPLPVLPSAQITPPVLPQQVPGQPSYMDLDQNQLVTFAVPVDHAALYRFETTGLLETDGAIRTRINPSLAEADGNGVGRNFLLQQYLREGDYQLAVHPVGQTTGHLGIAVTETPLIDEGTLAPDLPGRITLEPGDAAAYRFHIPAQGTYHIYTLGLGHGFTMRLEDSDGWPLLAPGGPADAQLDFAPGDYRMILLPQTVESRAVTVLHQITEPVTRQGHGPFEVAFGEDLANRWNEPSKGQPRTPDRWHFILPAPATITVSIDSGMRAVVLGPASAAGRVALTNAPWTGKLPGGDYTIEATSAAPNNRVDYLLHVDVAELVAGQSRDVTAPTVIPLSFGADQQYEISSFGDQDVRASLYDAGGHLIAANDDRDDDWNFLISGRYPAGQYTLHVDPVGTDSAQTEVSLASPAEIDDPPLRLGTSARIADGQVHVMALPAVAPGSLMMMAATAPVPAGLALEARNSEGTWRNVSSSSAINPYLAVPAGSSAYRLRVWSVDHGGTPIDVAVTSIAPVATHQTPLASGIDLLPVTFGRRQLGVRYVSVDHPMVLQIVGAEDTLEWSSAADVPVARDPTGTIVATANYLWLVDAVPHAITARQVDLLSEAARLTLGAGELELPLAASQTSGEVALWQVSGQGAQPGISIGQSGSNSPIKMALAGSTGALERALAFQQPNLQNPTLRLWQAGLALDALPVTVQRIAFPAPDRFSASIGDNDGQIDAVQALQAGLPAGWNRISLNLPAGMAAVLSRGGQTQSLIAGNGTTPDVIETDAGTLLLLNPNPAPASFSVSIEPLPNGSGLRLAQGGLLTHYSATPAILHVPITGGAVTQLRIAGAATDLTAIDAGGHVTTGTAARAGAGSVAQITMEPGLAVVSIDGRARSEPPSLPVTAPGVVPLAGKRMILTLAPADARLIHIETDAPVILRDQSTAVPELFASGAELNLFQPKGRALNLDIEAVGDQALTGTARFEAISATPISDGLGPRLRVAPGESRLFTFSLSQPRTIGVGVRGSVDNASTRLLASDGTELGRGVVHMHDLPPGTYFLAVDVPASGAATDIQPALVGMTLPDNGPPDDVKAEYLPTAAGD